MLQSISEMRRVHKVLRCGFFGLNGKRFDSEIQEGLSKQKPVCVATCTFLMYPYIFIDNFFYFPVLFFGDSQIS